MLPASVDRAAAQVRCRAGSFKGRRGVLAVAKVWACAGRRAAPVASAESWRKFLLGSRRVRWGKRVGMVRISVDRSS